MGMYILEPLETYRVNCCETCGAHVPSGVQWRHNNFHIRLNDWDSKIESIMTTIYDQAARILALEQELEKKQNPMFVINREDDGSLRIRPAQEPDAEDPF